MTQTLIFPELPERDLDWYKTRYEGLHEDVAQLNHDITLLEIDNKSYEKHTEMLQAQLATTKDTLDVLWDLLDAYDPKGMNRLKHDD